MYGADRPSPHRPSQWSKWQRAWKLFWGYATACATVAPGNPASTRVALPVYAEPARRCPAPDVSVREAGTGRIRDLLPPERFFFLAAPPLPEPSQPLRTLDTYPTNLPTQPSPFLGRTQERAEMQALLQGEMRLVTLIAPSGMGKTRFALDIAAHLLDDFPQGVYCVPLSPINDPELVLPTIARTLGLKEQGNQAVLTQFQHYLRERATLLVLMRVRSSIRV